LQNEFQNANFEFISNKELDMSEESHPKAHISFEGPKLGQTAPTVTITGVPTEELKRPEKIMKLMELLELPEGTNARIVYSTSDVIVR
jgi:hypothetical protein